KHANLIYHGKNEELFHENVDVDKKQQIGNKYNLSKFILYVSNIHRYKNFFELIKAFSLICNKIDNEIKLVLVGRCFDGGYYDEMIRFIREKGLEERILFLGEIPYDELPFLYASCMLFIYPSTCENCPNILIEAMACGAPILASNAEPMPEMCGNAAVYFDTTNPITMADTIFRTITDKNLILTLKENSLKRVIYFSWENAITRTLKIFKSVV
ncbi:MAG: glycosyltransferase family 1 protein, partial [Candidatus Firestonebacteria bacterium]